ncbi:MAG: hypothetical protein JSU97_09320, partial [Dehalococcoidia bacterium]
DEDGEIRVRPADSSVLPDWFGQEDAREVPTWERQLWSLVVASDTRILVSLRDSGERALVICRPADAFGRTWLVRIGLAADGQPTDVAALLRAAAADSGGTYLLAGDEPEGSATHRILEGLGFREVARGLAMMREL